MVVVLFGPQEGAEEEEEEGVGVGEGEEGGLVVAEVVVADWEDFLPEECQSYVRREGVRPQAVYQSPHHRLLVLHQEVSSTHNSHPLFFRSLKCGC